MWNVHIVPSHLIWDLKTVSDAAHYLLEEGKELCKCLTWWAVWNKSFNRSCFGVSRNWRWGWRCCWEQVSKIHTAFSSKGKRCCWETFRDQVAQCFHPMAAVGSFGPLEVNKSSSEATLSWCQFSPQVLSSVPLSHLHKREKGSGLSAPVLCHNQTF